MKLFNGRHPTQGHQLAPGSWLAGLNPGSAWLELRRNHLRSAELADGKLHKRVGGQPVGIHRMQLAPLRWSTSLASLPGSPRATLSAIINVHVDHSTLTPLRIVSSPLGGS